MKLHKNIKLISWFNFFTDFKLYAPIAIIYFSEVSGSYALGMSIFSVVMLSAAIFEIPTGIFSDLIGRKKTISLGAIGSLISVVFYAIGHSYIYLIIGAIFEGFSRALFSGNNSALLYDTLAEEEMESEFHVFSGNTSSMFQIALGISAILGSIIANFSLSLVFWLSVIPQFISYLVSLKMVNVKKTKQETGNAFVHLKEALKLFYSNKKLRLLNIASVVGYSIGESAFKFISIFYKTVWPIWAIGPAKALSNIGAAISFKISGKIINKHKEFVPMIVARIYSRIATIIAVVFPNVFSPVLISSTSIFYGIVSTAKESLFQKEFTDKQRATMSSLNSLFGSLGFAITSFSVGLVADRIGPAKTLLLLQFLAFSVIYLYWRLFRKYS